MKLMRKTLSLAAMAALLLCAIPAKAQYGTIANQVTGILGPILSGSANYKGYVEASYVKGIGTNQTDFLGISTSQGVMYGPRFFMGLGLGADWLMAHVDAPQSAGTNGYPTDKQITRNGCVIPVFSDFRFIVGKLGGTTCQLGLKMGCSFLVSSNYIEVNDGYITSSECFYLKPSVGVRIPTSSTNAKQAVSISANYQLMTPDYRQWLGNGNKAVTLNGFGVTLGYEW